jgi:hypothetical protein
MTSIMSDMNTETHLDISELIDYSRGIYSKAGPADKNYVRIAGHLSNCTECLNLLHDIRNLKEEFDEVWDKLFPLPATETVEQLSQTESTVLKWIGNARIRKELDKVLGEVESFIRDRINRFFDFKIKSLVTTHGPTIEGEVTLYFLDSIDISKFYSIVLKDNDLIFHAGSDPGYKKICIVGPGQLHRIARIIKYAEGKYIAKFSDVEVSTEGCFVHLY